MRTLRAAVKMALFCLFALLLTPLQTLVLLFFKGPCTYRIPGLWHKLISLVFGIRYDIHGTPNTAHQTFYVANHLSYLDVTLLGSILPASFVSKTDVQAMPVFGYFAKLQQCIFIDRRKTGITSAKDQLNDFLSTGGNIIMFPEGTSTSGMDVLPFRSSLFSFIESGDHAGLWIQPITIALLETDGRKAVTRDDFNIYAWPLEMETSLPAHLWGFAKTSGAGLVVTFHDPVPAAAHTDRKALAKACHDSVSMGLRTALAA